MAFRKMKNIIAGSALIISSFIGPSVFAESEIVPVTVGGDGRPRFEISKVDLTNNKLDFGIYQISLPGNIANLGAWIVDDTEIEDISSISEDNLTQVFYTDTIADYYSYSKDITKHYVASSEVNLAEKSTGKMFYLVNFSNDKIWTGLIDYSDCLSGWTYGKSCNADIFDFDSTLQVTNITYTLSDIEIEQSGDEDTSGTDESGDSGDTGDTGDSDGIDDDGDDSGNTDEAEDNNTDDSGSDDTGDDTNSSDNDGSNSTDDTAEDEADGTASESYDNTEETDDTEDIDDIENTDNTEDTDDTEETEEVEEAEDDAEETPTEIITKVIETIREVERASDSSANTLATTSNNTSNTDTSSETDSTNDNSEVEEGSGETTLEIPSLGGGENKINETVNNLSWILIFLSGMLAGVAGTWFLLSNRSTSKDRR